MGFSVRMDVTIIGYLIQGALFVCKGCYRQGHKDDPTTVYLDGLEGHSQRCSVCQTLVVDGFRKPDGSVWDRYPLCIPDGDPDYEECPHCRGQATTGNPNCPLCSEEVELLGAA